MGFKTFYDQSNFENSNQGWQVRIHIAPPQMDMRKDYPKSLEQIKSDFQNHNLNLDVKFANVNLEKLIANNPVQIQTMFRQLALLQQEEKENKYDDSNQIYEIDLLNNYKVNQRE